MTKRKFFCLFLALAMSLNLSLIVFAADAPSSGFHKTNGCGSEYGGGKTYSTTITTTCSRITAWGDSDSGNKRVHINVYSGTTSSPSNLVFSATITLNRTEQNVSPMYSTRTLYHGTYTIVITTSDSVPYEVATYFYK